MLGIDDNVQTENKHRHRALRRKKCLQNERVVSYQILTVYPFVLKRFSD